MTIKRITTVLLLLMVGAVVAGGAYVLSRPEPGLRVQAQLAISQALSGTDYSDFARVLEPREFSFPEDHGPHPEYAIEWWYFTGNLDSGRSRHFGFELTFFRIALGPEPRDRGSDWATSQLYMGHFALTDVEDDRFYSFERFSRQALDLAGATFSEDQTFRVWLETWSAELDGAAKPIVRLRAREENIAIDLTLESAKPLTLQGDGGYSQKGAAPGNASYYYSITRMPTTGTLTIGQQSFNVEGTSWMDREWSTSALADDQVGWDWFALQLSDGRDVMFYQLRLQDGGIDPHSSGAVIAADGSMLPLASDDVQIQVLDHWRSPRGGSYPSRWRVIIPAAAVDLVITPYIKNQELNASVRYWEGAVRLSGTSYGQPISGSGYVEMTGYATRSGGRF